MKAPIYARALSPAEQAGIEAGLRSSNAFTLRRSQILLASSREQRPSKIALNLGCATQTVRNAIHAFEQKGLDCLKQESSLNFFSWFTPRQAVTMFTRRSGT